MNNEATSEHMDFGVHLMIDGYHGSEAALTDKDLLHKALTELPPKMGMIPISEPTITEVGPNNKKDPGGVSGFVLIAESHISFHTFPKRGFVTIDVYTCQDTVDEAGFVREFTEIFGLKEVESQTIRRGTKYPTMDIY